MNENKRFENRLNKSNIKFNTLNPVWDNEKEDALNVFEMIDLLNELNTENIQLKSSNLEYEDALGRLEEEKKIIHALNKIQRRNLQNFKHRVYILIRTHGNDLLKEKYKKLIE